MFYRKFSDYDIHDLFKETNKSRKPTNRGIYEVGH